MNGDHDTQRAIGKLQGQVEGLKDQIDGLITLVRDQGQRAEASRFKLYQRVDDTNTEMVAVKGRMTHVETTVKRIEPMALDFAKLKQRGYGMLAALSLVWIIIGGAVMSGAAAVWGWVVKALTQSA